MQKIIVQRLFVMLLAFGFFFGSIWAEKHRKRGHFFNADVLTAMLDLREDQTNKIKKIDKKFKLDIKAMHKKKMPIKRELKKLLYAEQPDLTKIRKKFETIAALKVEKRMLAVKRRIEVEKVLNKEQRLKLRKILKAKHESRHKKR